MITHHQGQSWMLDDRRIVDPDARSSQQLLAIAHTAQSRPLCQCVDGGVETYVAKTPSGRFVIKRLPNGGPRHHPSCESYEPPPALSGRSAITTTEDTEGATVLRLGFPLTRDTAHQKPRASSEHSGRSDRDRHATTPPGGRLTLEGLLHYLWDEAGFTRWSPRMAGKRNWSLIRYHLTRAAEQTVVADQSLDRLVWIPEPFDPRRRGAIETRRQEAWTPLQPKNSQPRRFGVALVEWSRINPARYGQAITVRQMRWPPFMVDDDVLRALTVRFPQLELHTQHPDEHLLMAATFSLTRGGYPVVEDAAFMVADRHWLPYDSTAARELLAAAVATHRRFTTPLRYGLPTARPLPTLVLTDTTQPVAAYIAASDNAAEQAQHAADEAGVPAWVWRTPKPIPPLPPPD